MVGLRPKMPRGTSLLSLPPLSPSPSCQIAFIYAGLTSASHTLTAKKYRTLCTCTFLTRQSFRAGPSFVPWKHVIYKSGSTTPPLIKLPLPSNSHVKKNNGHWLRFHALFGQFLTVRSRSSSRFALLPRSDSKMCPNVPNCLLLMSQRLTGHWSEEVVRRHEIFPQIVPDTGAKCSGCLFSPYLQQCNSGTHPSCGLLIKTL